MINVPLCRYEIFLINIHHSIYLHYIIFVETLEYAEKIQVIHRGVQAKNIALRSLDWSVFCILTELQKIHTYLSIYTGWYCLIETKSNNNRLSESESDFGVLLKSH